MAAKSLLSGSEWRVMLLRCASVLVSASTGLIALKVFLAFGPQDAASLVAIVGWLVFIPLAQWGFGRPAYGALRARYSTGRLGAPLVRSLAGLFAKQSALAAVIFSAVAWAIATRQGFGGSLADVAVFALGLAALTSSAYQRDLAYGVSRENPYESWEFVRRCAALAGYGLIAAGLPLWLLGVGCMAVAAWSQWRVGHAVTTHLQPATGESAPGETHWRSLQPPLGPDARRYLLFSANELLLYNLPLVAFTVLQASAEVIYAAIWLRLFQLLVLPMRMVVDTRLNRQMTAYFQRDAGLARREIGASFGMACAITAVSVLGVVFGREPIFHWLGAGTMASDAWLMASLGIWGIGNTIQHVFGSFTVSHGAGFGFSLRTSAFSLAAVALAFGVLHALDAPLGLTFFCLGAVYTGFSVLYVRHVRALLGTLQADSRQAA